MKLYEIKKGKKDTITRFIRENFSKSKENMQSYYRQWALTLAWVRGHQNIDFQGGKFVKSQKHSWQTRLIANKLLPQMRNSIARLLQSNPIWEVHPATPDEEDIEIAHVSTKVLQEAFYNTNMRLNLVQLLTWQSCCGNAFAKIGWDSEAGEDTEVNTNDVTEELLDSFLSMMGIEVPPEVLTLKTGESFVEVIPPFNLICDPLVTMFHKSQWSLETQIRSKDYIVEKYGNKWRDKLTETKDIEIFMYPFIYGENTGVQTGVKIQELFIKKCPQFKDGLHVVMSEDNVLHKQSHPFDHGELPYVHFLEIFDCACMWGTSTVLQNRSQQAQYNAINSKITDTINLTGAVQWLIPTQSRVTDITNRPGAKISYNAPYKPEPVQPRGLPAYIENALERTQRDMQDTSSLHNVSRGKSEPGLRSGRSILALQETDDLDHLSTLWWFDDALKSTGKQLIKVIKQHVSEDKTITTIGEFGEQEVTTFTGSDLTGTKGDYFDVRVQNVIHQTLSRAAREQQIARLVELTVLDPQKDRFFILGVLGLRENLLALDEYAADRARQHQEITRILNGEDVKVTFGENHEVHVASVKKFIASSRRNKIKPEQLQKIQMHLDNHWEMQALELAKQAAYMQRFGILGADDGGQSQSQQRNPKRRTTKHKTK